MYSRNNNSRVEPLKNALFMKAMGTLAKKISGN